MAGVGVQLILLLLKKRRQRKAIWEAGNPVRKEITTRRPRILLSVEVRVI